MKKQLLLINLLLLSLGFLFIPNTQAQQCVKNPNTRLTDYMQREGDKRCEGVVKRIDTVSSFSLISFTIGSITSLTNPLKLEVPNNNNQPPKVRLISFPKNYQLDTVASRNQNTFYQFQWDNKVIKNAQIDPNTLRATASVNAGQKIYLPIILRRGAGEYSIVLNSESRVSITEFKILQNNQVIYTTSRPDFQPKGQIPFTWNGRNNDGKIAPAGLYELRINAKQEQEEAPPQPASINITFVHNPQWLK